jgi:predicted transposase YbfD/YdcC
VADLSLLERPFELASLQALVRIESERYHKASGNTERETRYYISSLKPDARRLNGAIRQHWGIENKLHWVLDVGFGEDLDRKRAGHAAQNFSLLNRIALNLLKQETTFKRGIKGKRLKAAWNHPDLLGLRPMCWPSNRARRMPARTLSMIELRSRSATAPTMMMMARLSGLPVSIFSRKLTYSTFSRFNSPRTSRKCFTDLAILSDAHTRTTSN